MVSKPYTHELENLQSGLQLAHLFLYVPYVGIIAGLVNIVDAVRTVYSISRVELIAWSVLFLYLLMMHWLSLGDVLF